MEHLDKIYKMCEGLDKVFPSGNDPYQMVARLAEECGELAAEVNHFEGSGVKRSKHGEPNPKKLAKEVMDVIRCALQIARYYSIETQLDDTISTHYQKMQQEGLIES